MKRKLFRYQLSVLTEDGKRFGPNVVAFAMMPDVVGYLDIYNAKGERIRNPMLPEAYREQGGYIIFFATLPVCDVLVSCPWGSRIYNRLTPSTNGKHVVINTKPGQKRIIVPCPGGHTFYGHESGIRLPPNARDVRVWFRRGMP